MKPNTKEREIQEQARIFHSMKQYQLRIYSVKRGEMKDWLTEWREKIAPLRREHGFVVVGSWFSEKEDRFVWILGWDGDGTYEEADRRYYDSPQRKALAPDPARHVERVEHMMMSST
jgi:ribosomal protein L11 methylase PrmA